MQCSSCGTSHPKSTNACMSGGAPPGGKGSAERPAGRVEWEYRDLIIPLSFSPFDLDRVEALFDPVIRERLDQARQDGWHPDEQTDFASLNKADRLQGSIRRDFGGPSDYTSATIRVKRQIAILS